MGMCYELIISWSVYISDPWGHFVLYNTMSVSKSPHYSPNPEHLDVSESIIQESGFIYKLDLTREKLQQL